jgi:hypothetical protein
MGRIDLIRSQEALSHPCEALSARPESFINQSPITSTGWRPDEQPNMAAMSGYIGLLRMPNDAACVLFDRVESPLHFGVELAWSTPRRRSPTEEGPASLARRCDSSDSLSTAPLVFSSERYPASFHRHFEPRQQASDHLMPLGGCDLGLS